MLRKFKSMKLKKRMNYSYKIIIGIMIMSSLLSITGSVVILSNFTKYEKQAQAADTAAKDCIIRINRAARYIREMAINDDTGKYGEYRENIENEIDSIGNSLERLYAADSLEDGLFIEYSDALNSWGEIGYSIMDVIEAGDNDKAEHMILEECVPALSKVLTVSNQIEEITNRQKNGAIIGIYATSVAGIVLVLLFIAGAVAAAAKLGRAVVASVMEPIAGLDAAMAELARGNLHSDIELEANDEVGMLAASLKESKETLASYVDDISRAMKEFAEGNFDVQPEVEWKGDFVGILDSFMKFEKSMADTVKGIQRAADQVKAGSDQVAQGSADLAQGATEQAGVTEELTATIETLADRVTDNAQNVKDISRKVEAVENGIMDGNDKMEKMIASMDEIEKASREIGRIIKTINDIASQTNLLALNASIEAARAGDAGKGFAVVADQVSMLAAQSADAAKESAALIESSVKAVENGIIAADAAAKRLADVVEGSKVITREVNGVADELANEKDSFEQIKQGVEQINDVVQTNSATSEECAASSQQMNEQAVALEELIRKLRVAHFKK